ncbi:MAG TPA: hypothetical protein VKR05_00460 [Candidatus Cybelea sp.]|nr:hypothetical protein [Candidatus Cybelea sp.]
MMRIFIGSFALTLAVAGAWLPAAAQEYPPPGALPPASAASATAKPDPAMLGRARHFFQELQTGNVDRSDLAAGPNANMNNATISNAQHMIGSLGTPVSFVQQQAGSQNGVSWAIYLVTFKNGQSIDFLYGVGSDGKITTLGLGTPR